LFLIFCMLSTRHFQKYKVPGHFQNFKIPWHLVTLLYRSGERIKTCKGQKILENSYSKVSNKAESVRVTGSSTCTEKLHLNCISTVKAAGRGILFVENYVNLHDFVKNYCALWGCHTKGGLSNIMEHPDGRGGGVAEALLGVDTSMTCLNSYGRCHNWTQPSHVAYTSSHTTK